jgi:hypothetical protein
MKNFITLGQPLSGRKVCGTEKKKNNPKNSGHFVPLQRLRAVHALRSDLELKLSWAAIIPSKFADLVQPQMTEPVLKNWSQFKHSPYSTISPFLVPIWSLFYQTGPYSAKIAVRARNIMLQ